MISKKEGAYAPSFLSQLISSWFGLFEDLRVTIDYYVHRTFRIFTMELVAAFFQTLGDITVV
jgi:hypothetical protein